MEFAELQAVARQIGGRGNLQSAKCRWEIIWTSEMAWSFMSVDGFNVVWDGVECHMPLTRSELYDKVNDCSKGDRQGAAYCSNNVHFLPYNPRDLRSAFAAITAFKRFIEFCRSVWAQKILAKWNAAE